MPTAQYYYKKCIEKTKIDATWDLVRWKVRHLKMGFKKAEDWRKSTGAGLLEADQGISSIKGKSFNDMAFAQYIQVYFICTF